MKLVTSFLAVLLSLAVPTDFKSLEASDQVGIPIPDIELKAHIKPLEAKEIATLAVVHVEPPKPAVAPQEAPEPVTGGSHEDWMRAAGIPESEWWAVDWLVSRESGWKPCAYNPGKNDCAANPKTACGLVQQYPCHKIPGDWRDPIAALKWQANYVKKYGGYAGAVAHWKSAKSY